MRIDNLFIISLDLLEHRIQSSRKIIHAFVDLQNAKKEKEKKKNEANEVKINSQLRFSSVIEHSIN